MKKGFLSALLFFFITHTLYAQSANDNCSNASVINIPNSGFYIGNVTSTTYDISNDGIEAGETFAPAILSAGLFQKSMWFEFSIPTSRALSVTLLQPGSAIGPTDAGFCIYKTSSCIPGNTSISTKLTPLAQFGSTFHPCVDSGVYLIQVSSNTTAKGPLYIQLSLADTSQTLYNFPTTAYNFGVVSNTAACVIYSQDCLTIDSASDYCTLLPNYPDYNRSSWHTFTTGNYVDYVGIQFDDYPNYAWWVSHTPYVGIKFYQGNCKTTTVSSLTLLSTDTLSYNNKYSTKYVCQLQPNTTYSFELFFREDYYNTLQVEVLAAGVQPANGPQPVLSALPASNKLGVLPMSVAGSVTTFTDNFGCNSELSSSACGTANPAGGIISAGVKYDLSTWFTFTLSADADVNFYNAYAIGFNNGCAYHSWYPSELVRIFSQGMTNSCSSLDTSNLYAQFLQTDYLICMPAGTYSVQLMGYDSSYNWYLPIDLGTLGASANITMDAYTIPVEQFGLAVHNHFDSLNTFQPLQVNVAYNTTPDTMGCANTVLPSNSSCDTSYHKAIYTEFKVQDSGVVNISPIYWWSPSPNLIQLFSGDANALTNAQNTHSYPQTFNGLTPITTCTDNVWCVYTNQGCVIPGTYTMVNTSNTVGYIENTTITFYKARTKHYSAATVQNLGNILDSMSVYGGSAVSSDVDTFSCIDNADTIGGVAPCNSTNGNPGTKAIYRQFYLSSPQFVTINTTANWNCGWRGTLNLFNGEASNGLNTLTPVGAPWNCFYNTSSPACTPLPAGWYTIVAYGAGPTYGDPAGNYGYGGNDIGFPNQIGITVTTAPPGPKYDRPYKACIDTATKAPFNIQWGPRIANTAAYPETDTTYNLYTEYFNCTLDTPFSSQPIVSCGPSFDRVAYFTFTIVKESFVIIYAGGYEAEVFPFDVRKDSTEMLTVSPVQPCVQASTFLQICKMQPGVYTLVIFAADANDPSSVTPSIYVDQVGYSRFDFANKAYDFGVVPPDKQYHWGKPGDVNPLNPLRAPSDDFFYCTTGSAPTDPIDATCYAIYDSAIYGRTINNCLYNNVTNPPPGWACYSPRRNLWYTFVVDYPGSVHVKVVNKTPDKQYQYQFAVYSSSVHDTLPFSTIVAGGLVDSTVTQGLQDMPDSAYYNYASNIYGGWCDGWDSITFFRNPCANLPPMRYYILVDNRDANGYSNCTSEVMAPNSQVEVAVLVDSIDAIPTKFDHYYEANNIGSSLGPGCYQGAQDNFMCATGDPTDPSLSNGAWTCAKTLWYKFTTVTSGYVRRRINVNGKPMPNADYNDIELYREIIPGDSTTNGLEYINYSNYTDSVGDVWEVSCVFPGTYYLILPGCSMNAQYVIPYICILDQSGDFCSDPVTANVNGPGNYEASAVVDCNTIGTDYGEFGPTLSCPPGAVTSKYKSTWFRIDIQSNDTMDVTVYLNDNTNAGPADIEYRLMTGDCTAMQEGSCVENAQTQNTYRCLTQGSYYIQVFEPIISPENNQSVTGQVQLIINAIPHADTCANIKKCLATASFVPSFNCNVSDSLQITNYSTYGTTVKYLWNFGYNNDTSSEVVPYFVYPHLDHDSTYNIKLVVTNTSCGGKDSLTTPILIPARAGVHLGDDTSFCLSGSYTLHATSFPGATYSWSNGSTDSIVNITTTGNSTYAVTVTYATCTAKAKVDLNLLSPPTVNLGPAQVLCTGDSITFSTSNPGFNYTWSNGNTTSAITVHQPGTYWVKVADAGCSASDTVIVTSSGQFHPFVRDTALCTGATLTLNATNPNATAYQWQDGSTSSQYQVTTAGNYWVNITLANCAISDSITVAGSSPLASSSNMNICLGQNYTLPGGKVVTNTGTYIDTLTAVNGCDSVVTTNLTVSPAITTSQLEQICQGQNYTLPGGKVVTNAGTYIDTLIAKSGCDSIVTTSLSIKPTITTNVTASICQGQNYTLPDGAVVSTAGIYYDTLAAKNSCDSVVTTSLSINPIMTTNVAASICFGQSYILPNGKTITTVGIYNDTMTAKTGCDSIIVTSLTINPVITTNVTASICQGGNYTLPNGTSVSVAGIYADTLITKVGCDSVVITSLAIIPIVPVNVTAKACQGQSYTLPNGTSVTTGGIYTDTLITKGGCDSVVVTSLVYFPTSATSAAVQICQGQSYTLPGGKAVTTSNTYIDTLTAVNGCDSIITTALTVNPVATSSVNLQICNGQSYTLPGGNVVTASGTYIDTLTAKNGCDSIITTSLSVVKILTTTINPMICQGQNYTLPNGVMEATTGIYIDTLMAKSGCDSVITINLLINPTYAVSINASVCQGQNYALPDGKVVTISGTYTSTLMAKSGCDSVITTLLTINPTFASTIGAQICSGSNYTLPDGTVVSAAGNYTSTLTAKNGCDSVVTTQLIVNPVYNTPVNAKICQGQNYTLPDGTTVNSTGKYSSTLKAITGCDSVIATNLTVIPILTTTINPQICQGGNYTLPNGTEVTDAGTYIDTLTALSGCDSVVTVNLIVNSVYAKTANAQACQGQNYTLPDGKVVNAAGNYTSNLTSKEGCDSTIITTLTLEPILTTTVDTQICQGQNYALPDNKVVTKGGTYTTTLIAKGGCDSVITTVLTADSLPDVSSLLKSAICTAADGSITLNVTGGQSPYQYQWSNSSTGTQLSSLPAGKYSVTVTDANHCPRMLTITLPDSTEHIVLDVVVNPIDGCEPLTVKINNNTTQPGNYIWSFGDGTTDSSPDPTHVYPLSGTYSLDVIFTSTEGCIDTFTGVSIIHVYDFPVAEFSETPSGADTFYVNNATFYFSNQSTGMVSCLWNFGDSTSSNSISPAHTYKQPGSFIVTLIVENSDGCSDTIRSREIVVVPEGNYFIPNTFTPNGDGINDYFKVYGYSIKGYTLSVYSRWGERVYESDGTDKGWDGTFHGMLMNSDVFVYYARIEYIDGHAVSVQGDVTLLR